MVHQKRTTCGCNLIALLSLHNSTQNLQEEDWKELFLDILQQVSIRNAHFLTNIYPDDILLPGTCKAIDVI